MWVIHSPTSKGDYLSKAFNFQSICQAGWNMESHYFEQVGRGTTWIILFSSHPDRVCLEPGLGEDQLGKRDVNVRQKLWKREPEIRSDTKGNENAWMLEWKPHQSHTSNANNTVSVIQHCQLVYFRNFFKEKTYVGPSYLSCTWKDCRRHASLLIFHVTLGGIETQIECSAPLNPSLHCTPMIQQIV